MRGTCDALASSKAPRRKWKRLQRSEPTTRPENTLDQLQSRSRQIRSDTNLAFFAESHAQELLAVFGIRRSESLVTPVITTL
jgi:hypothetical protein